MTPRKTSIGTVFSTHPPCPRRYHRKRPQLLLQPRRRSSPRSTMSASSASNSSFWPTAALLPTRWRRECTIPATGRKQPCVISQFEQHIRAVAGLPLGNPARHADCVMQNLIGDDIPLGSRLAGARQHARPSLRQDGSKTGPQDGSRDDTARRGEIHPVAWGKSPDSRLTWPKRHGICSPP